MFNFILLLADSQLSQHHLLERLFFPHLIVLAPFLKIFNHKCKSLFVDSQSYPFGLYVCP